MSGVCVCVCVRVHVVMCEVLNQCCVFVGTGSEGGSHEARVEDGKLYYDRKW